MGDVSVMIEDVDNGEFSRRAFYIAEH